MLLVDEIEIDSEGVAHAKYRIKEDEFFCRGHFPALFGLFIPSQAISDPYR